MNFVVRFFKFLWSLFLNGLVMLLPIALTLTLFTIFFKLIQSWLEPVNKLHPYLPELIQKIPYIELILIFTVIFVVGIILRILVLRSIVHSVEGLIARIPLFRPVYTGIKQLVLAFGVQDKRGFKQVVLIEFPRKGVFSIGFMTNEMPRQVTPNKEEKYFSIFIPTTPNPTNGYFAILSEKEIRPVDLSRQEAMALIISGGIIQPDRFKDPI